MVKVITNVMNVWDRELESDSQIESPQVPRGRSRNRLKQMSITQDVFVKLDSFLVPHCDAHSQVSLYIKLVKLGQVEVAYKKHDEL